MSPTMVNCLWVLLIAAGVASAVEVSVAIRQILTFELFISRKDGNSGLPSVKSKFL